MYVIRVPSYLTLHLSLLFFRRTSMRNASRGLALALSNEDRLLASTDEFLGAGRRDFEMFRGETAWSVAGQDLEFPMETMDPFSLSRYDKFIPSRTTSIYSTFLDLSYITRFIVSIVFALDTFDNRHIRNR